MRALRACGLLALIAMAALLSDAGARPAPDKEKDKEKADKADKDKSAFADLGDTHAEVTVLQVLHALQPTPAQLDLLDKVSAKTMQKAPPRKIVKVSEKYRKGLLTLRDALCAEDEEKIDEATADLDDIRETEDPDWEDTEITDAARKEAPVVLRSFSARQIAVYVGGLDDFPDPAERLREAIRESRKMKAKEWTTYRDDVAYQVGWLVAGLSTDAEEKVRDKATALLNKAARLSEKEFEEQREELEKAAAEVVGKVGPTDIIRNFMERLLAETLSNHRLAAALALRKKKNEKEGKG
jgi:hypothetical protein